MSQIFGTLPEGEKRSGGFARAATAERRVISEALFIHRTCVSRWRRAPGIRTSSPQTIATLTSRVATLLTSNWMQGVELSDFPASRRCGLGYKCLQVLQLKSGRVMSGCVDAVQELTQGQQHQLIIL